ncbi:K(+)-transporting ATPase subunit F [Clostridium ihumii]
MWIVVGVVIFLFGYLGYALFNPEKF